MASPVQEHHAILQGIEQRHVDTQRHAAAHGVMAAKGCRVVRGVQVKLGVAEYGLQSVSNFIN
jgi:hypothetical protein